MGGRLEGRIRPGMGGRLGKVEKPGMGGGLGRGDSYGRILFIYIFYMCGVCSYSKTLTLHFLMMAFIPEITKTHFSRLVCGTSKSKLQCSL